MLRNCIDCNRIFSHPTNKLCPKCMQKRNEMFNRVKDYLRTYPKAQLQEVVDQTGISLEQIREYINEGRLKIIPAGVQLHCQICGAIITKGRICRQCQKQLNSEQQETKKTPNDRRARMHLLESKRKKH